MSTKDLRTATARTIAAGFLAYAEGRYSEASEHADGATRGLLALSAQGVAAPDLTERVHNLDTRLTAQG